MPNIYNAPNAGQMSEQDLARLMMIEQLRNRGLGQVADQEAAMLEGIQGAELLNQFIPPTGQQSDRKMQMLQAGAGAGLGGMAPPPRPQMAGPAGIQGITRAIDPGSRRQGANDRLDERLGERLPQRDTTQTYQDRRDESRGARGIPWRANRNRFTQY